MGRPHTSQRDTRVQRSAFDLDRHSILMLAAILVATLVVYLPSFGNKFVNWDDYGYVVDNLAIRDLSFSSAVRLFTKLEFMGNYHPITMLTYAIEYTFFEGDPTGYHVTNVLLHLVNTALVFWFVRLLGGRNDVALIVGLLFGIHPMHVESVSWISERKDLLYTVFFLGSLISYLAWRRNTSRRMYALAIGLFVCALLSKAMAVSLVVVLFLLDVLDGRQFSRRTILEKLPFAGLALVAGVVALFAQHAAMAIHGFEQYTIGERVVLANYALASYVSKLIVPVNLSAFYPFPAKVNGAIPAAFWLYPAGMIAATAGVAYSLRTTKRILFGVGFFVATIALVLQVLQVGGAMMADRYSYVPSIGFFYLCAIGLVNVWERLSASGARWLMLAALGGYCGWLSVRTWEQSYTWRDSFSLWDTVLEQYPWITFARENRAQAYSLVGRYDEGLQDYNFILEHDPTNARAYHSRGVLFFHQGKFPEALADLNRAIDLKLDNAESFTNRGAVYAGMGNFEAAMADFNKAIELEPDRVDAYNNRGAEYAKRGMFEAAISDFDRALALNPRSPDAARNRELALTNMRAQQGPKQDQAPSAEYYLARGMQYGQSGNLQSAVADLSKAIELEPSYAEAYNNRGIAYAMLGRMDSSYADFASAIRLKPDYADAYFNRAVARRQVGDRANACADYAKAAALNHPGALQAQRDYCK
jgi:tetratricopeptide (TPR) repeat protein